MASNPKEIVFRLGEESFPTVLNAENQEKSPFAEIILTAEGRIESISKQLLDINTKIKQNHDQHNLTDKWEETTPTNIVAFLGERGSGKTSCMRTVVRDCKAKHADWMFLQEIDPSFFDECHNVLEILVGCLYGVFKKLCNDWKKKPVNTQNELRDVQEKFTHLKSAMLYLKNLPDLKDEYELDALNHLNAGGKIRVLIKDLIDSLLRYSDKELLVISIDDLDLNIMQSYLMMEHIRKYLILPNAIILVAAKYGQLFDSICRNFSGIYKEIQYRVTNRDIAVMAERYLNKLLPLDQRFEMPAVESYINSKLIIIDENGNQVEKDSILIGVPSLIFEKTRYLFYNSSGMPSLVIPRNLRDLRMLTTMLVRMSPINEAEQINKRTFKDYFFEEWLGKIDPEYRIFAKGLLEEENLAKVNRYVISNLYDFFISKTETYSSLKAALENAEKEHKDGSLIRQRQLLRNILNPANSYWNISVGDVVTTLNAIRRCNDSVKVTNILFFIESFYSIKLYETYDKMTGMTDNDGLKMPVDTTVTAPELKTSVRGDVPEYFRLTGGSFFSSSGDYFISPSSKAIDDRFREHFIINGKILLDEVRRLEKEYEKFPVKPSNKTKIPADLTFRLRLCEFFMLTVKHLVDLKSADKNARLQTEPLYFKKFGTTAKNMLFEIAMPFFNAIYPKWTYGRFGKSIFDAAKKDPNSVLNRMIQHKSRKKSNDTWEIMSKAAIRNMEILEDLTEWLHDRRMAGELSGTTIFEVQSKFFSQFDFSEAKDPIPKGKYCVKTYGRIINGKNKPYYYIDYSIFAELASVLHDMSYSGDDPDISLRVKEGINFYFSVLNVKSILPQRESYAKAELLEELRQYCDLAYLESYLHNYDSDLSDMQVADVLANLRINIGYDFNGILPFSLQMYYSKFVESKSSMELKRHEEEISILEEELKDLTSELNHQDTEAKQIVKYLNQNKAEIRKINADSIKIQKIINESQKNLDFYKSRIFSEVDSSEIKRLRKEEEKAIKALNSATAESQSLMEQSVYLHSMKDDFQSELNELTGSLKAKANEIRQTKKNIDDATKAKDNFKFIMDNPRPID